jgi:hypothetical protein
MSVYKINEDHDSDYYLVEEVHENLYCVVLTYSFAKQNKESKKMTPLKSWPFPFFSRFLYTTFPSLSERLKREKT